MWHISLYCLATIMVLIQSALVSGELTSGIYRIQNMATSNTKECTLRENGTPDESLYCFVEKNVNGNQLWSVDKVGSNLYSIKSVVTGNGFNVKSNTKDATVMITSYSRAWVITQYGNEYMLSAASDKNLYITARPGSMEGTLNLQPSDTPGQLFKFISVTLPDPATVITLSDGTYEIQNMATINTKDCTLRDRNIPNEKLYCNGQEDTNGYSRWSVEKIGNNVYTIRSKASGYGFGVNSDAQNEAVTQTPYPRAWLFTQYGEYFMLSAPSSKNSYVTAKVGENPTTFDLQPSNTPGQLFEFILLSKC